MSLHRRVDALEQIRAQVRERLWHDAATELATRRGIPAERLLELAMPKHQRMRLLRAEGRGSRPTTAGRWRS